MKSWFFVYKDEHIGQYFSLTINRYKDDIFDRIWWPYSDPEWTTLSTSLTVQSNENDYEPPSAVMSTAATPTIVNSLLDFYLDVPANEASGYYVYMRFTEVEELQGDEYRAFNINLNGQFWYCVYTVSAMTGGK